jgi:type IV pilus assembly protein PilA
MRPAWRATAHADVWHVNGPSKKVKYARRFYGKLGEFSPGGMQLRLAQRKAVINAKGFSLLELLVTVAIVSLLAAIAIPQFIAYRSRAVDSQMKGDLKNAALAMESYFAENKVYPTSLGAIIAAGFNQTDGVALTIAVPTPSSFTITATKPSGTQPNFTFDSVTGTIN